jgi:hypothetical protein
MPNDDHGQPATHHTSMASPADVGGLMRATVQFDGSTVTLLPRRAPVGNSAPVRGRPLTVFALDAGAGSDDDTSVVRTVLPRPEAEVFPALMQPGDVAGVAVFDLTADEAQAVCRALRLTSVLHWDGRRAQLLS